MTALETLGASAKRAAPRVAEAGSDVRTEALRAVAEALEHSAGTIIEANALDLRDAEKNGVAPQLIDRLMLDAGRIRAIADGVRAVAALRDPVGEIIASTVHKNGMVIARKRVPLGVVAIIYEARPNVTADAAALCLKSGNAVILRGGKEAFHSNKAIVDVMRGAIARRGLPEDAIALVGDTSRQSATELMTLTGYVDVLIPRGGAGLIRSVVQNAKVPVIETGIGNCHVYVDTDADLTKALDIIENAKCQRVAVCNAAESLLVARPVAERFLPEMKARLDRYSVELRGCPETAKILGPSVVPATEADYETEFYDYILAVKVVADAEEAMAHIATYSTGHSEAIVTENYTTAKRFSERVDAAAVYINASTRFTDGAEFGLGAEMGISTQKMHARGPMGPEALLSTKFVIFGEGQIRT
ncbi:glutamate-5-semialdehyde dehydrogenase [Oscillospiraceae bacterium OttesenSCG-928-F05]|nr:glutamate-5-semialdehyde dehydrogenase [Oscillospiraceae bacterium OttesenSCG-928-F05]